MGYSPWFRLNTDFNDTVTSDGSPYLQFHVRCDLCEHNPILNRQIDTKSGEASNRVCPLGPKSGRAAARPALYNIGSAANGLKSSAKATNRMGFLHPSGPSTKDSCISVHQGPLLDEFKTHYFIKWNDWNEICFWHVDDSKRYLSDHRYRYFNGLPQR